MTPSFDGYFFSENLDDVFHPPTTSLLCLLHMCAWRSNLCGKTPISENASGW